MKKPATIDETGATRKTEPTVRPRPARIEISVVNQAYGKVTRARSP